jgi:hypothetical protein
VIAHHQTHIEAKKTICQTATAKYLEAL